MLRDLGNMECVKEMHRWMIEAGDVVWDYLVIENENENGNLTLEGYRDTWRWAEYVRR